MLAFDVEEGVRVAEQTVAERLDAARVRDFSRLIEENTLVFIMGPNRKEYVAHDMPMRFWLKRINRDRTVDSQPVSDLEIVSACTRVPEETLLEDGIGLVETSKAAQVLIDHFLAQTHSLEMIRGMLHNPQVIEALYLITPRPSLPASELTPATTSPASST